MATTTRGGREPKPRPKPRPRKPPPRPKPKPGSTPAPAAAPAADHPTLDIGAMQQGGTGGDVTQVTTEGGPGQESAVFSTGPSSAEMLHYQQATTYQQVYADQIAQAQGGGQ